MNRNLSLERQSEILITFYSKIGHLPVGLLPDDPSVKGKSDANLT